jgi:hypothetical protein
MQNRRNNRRKDDPTRVWENQTAWRTVSKTFTAQPYLSGHQVWPAVQQVGHANAPPD